MTAGAWVEDWLSTPRYTTYLSQAGGDHHRARVLGGKVIAELTFGFWPYLFTRTRHTTIWLPYLRHAFPSGAVRDHLHEGLIELVAVRNRVAHHEPLAKAHIVPTQRRIERFANYVSPELSSYIKRSSEVDQIRTSRP